MQSWTRGIAAASLTIFTGAVAASGTLAGYPAAPRPGSTVVLEGRSDVPYTADQIQFYVRAPTADGGSDLRQLPREVLHFFPTHFIADLGVLTTEGRYRVEYYLAPAAPGSVPEAFYEFSVSASGVIPVVEYFNPTLGHYFITAFAAEMALLDAGTPAGWTRTGEQFNALGADTMPSSAMPVCRYYGLPSAGLDTHFYSDDPTECADVLKRWPDKWVLETTRAFGVEPVDYYNPQCFGDHQPLFRLYNNRPDANHRYTTSPAIRDAMIGQGWINETQDVFEGGSPDEGFSMCVLK